MLTISVYLVLEFQVSKHFHLTEHVELTPI